LFAVFEVSEDPFDGGAVVVGFDPFGGAPAVVLLKFAKRLLFDADRGLGEDFRFPLGGSS